MFLYFIFVCLCFLFVLCWCCVYLGFLYSLFFPWAFVVLGALGVGWDSLSWVRLVVLGCALLCRRGFFTFGFLLFDVGVW